MNTSKTIQFVITVFIATWSIWGLAILNSMNVVELFLPTTLLIVLGTFVPSTLGLIFLLRSSKKTLKEILKETFILKGETVYIVLTFLWIPALYFITYIITTVFFSATYDLPWLARPFELPILFLYILILGGPLGEEIGWRGYLLPRLLKTKSAFHASLILGLVWAFWHSPLFFIEGTVQSGVSFPLYVLYTVVLTFLITFLYLKTNKRTSTALYMHTSANTALGVFYLIDQSLGLMIVGILLLGSLLFTLMKFKTDFFSNNT